eukprot:c20066_g1_i1 orf=108-4985(-)
MGEEQGISAEVDIQELTEVGKRLTNPPSSKDSLCKLLKQALKLLGSIDQSPHERLHSAMNSSVEALVKPNLLKHKDKDVRLLVATCISEVMRIVAPEVPYSDEVLKDVFELIVASFKGLDETSSPHFERRVSILQAVATYKSCVVMLDLDCDDLIREMFQIFFSTVGEEPKYLMALMRTIMCLVLEESEEIPEQLLELLLDNLLREKKGVSKAGNTLARGVFEQCAEQLRPHVEAFLTSLMSEKKSSKKRWRESYHDLIFEIYTCAPTLLVPWIPKLTDELLTDELDVRLEAVKLLGRMFASQQGVSDLFEQLFVEYVKRFTDKAVEVRLAMVECTKQCLLAKPSGLRARDILAALSDRLQDFDNGVRLHVVRAICDLAQSNPELTLVDELKRVAERLRDTEVTVRRETLQRLIDLYRSFCSKKAEGLPVESFSWIPSKLIRCCFDRDSKEFRTQGMELVFSEQLFPLGFPVKERVKCWIAFFSAFDSNDVKALERILHQKQRLHFEMQNFLLLRQKLKDEESQEVETRLLALCKSMASFFADPSNAEIQLQKLIQLKDSKLLKDLVDLLDSNIPKDQSLSIKTDLLKRLGEKHPQYEFLKVLSVKCSYALFGKEHMHSLLAELKELRTREDENLLKASMGLLVAFANHFPTLLDGAEGELMELLKEDRDFLKEGVVQVLAKVGGSMRGRFTEESNSVDLLEKLCVDGSRKQAKYAVQALAAMSNDSGFKVFSGLYRKLLDLLESDIKLPTILQSLGCIAQYAISVFEAHEEDLVNFLVRDLFRRDSLQAPSEGDDTEDHPVGETTRLKIFGLKTLVRSFLPNKDSQQVQRFKGLFGILLKFLEFGEITDDIKSSGNDKAHLRLAAAKGVLRLSKRYDAQISAQLFQATVLCAKDPSVFLKRQFLGKVQKLLKERHVPQKYACALALSIGVTADDFLTEAKQQLGEFVELSRRQGRLREPFGSGHLDTPSFIYSPEYVLFYLVHVLAQEAEFPRLSEGGPRVEDVELYFKQLSLFIWALLNHDRESAQNNGNGKEEFDKVSLIFGVFCAMKDAEDTVDASKTENTYILCDIGITIVKKLVGVEELNLKDISSIPLPKSMYKSLGGPVKDNQKLSYLPSFFGDDDSFSQMLPFHMDVDVGLRKRKADHVENGSLENAEKPFQKRNKVPELSSGKEEGPVQKRNKVTESSGKNEQQESKVSLKLPGASKRQQALGHRSGQQEKAATLEIVANPEKLDMIVTSPKQKRGRHLFKDDEDETLSSVIHKRGRHKPINEADEDVKDEAQVSMSEVVNHAAEAAAPEADDSARRHVRISIKKPRPPQEPADSFLKGTNDSTAEKRHDKEVLDGIVKDATDNAKAHAQGRKSPGGTPRKSGKNISISHLERPNSKVDKNGEASDEELLHKRVRVWWPLDKRFYKGTIRAYNADKKLHDVVYDDGDKETLNLKKERWELIQDKKSGNRESPSIPTTSRHGSQLKMKKGRQQTKRISKEISTTSSLPESSRSPKKVKLEASTFSSKPIEGERSKLPDAKEDNPSDAKEDIEGNKADDGKQTSKPDKFSKHQSKARKPSQKATSSTPRARGSKSLNLKSDDRAHDGSPSPTASKDSENSDNIPLNAWKFARKKGHG